MQSENENKSKSKKGNTARNIIVIVIVLLLAFGISLGTSLKVCDSVVPASAGVNGSAYEIAVQNGYSGTDEEWLASLVGEVGKNGESAYDLAVKNGYFPNLSVFKITFLLVLPQISRFSADFFGKEPTGCRFVLFVLTLSKQTFTGSASP